MSFLVADGKIWKRPFKLPREKSLKNSACIYQTFAFKLDNLGQEEHYFLYQTTQTVLPSIPGEEKERSSADNRYLPTWVRLDQLPHINLQPHTIQEMLIRILKKTT